MRLLYPLLLLFLSFALTGQIVCPPDSFVFADAIDAPKFRDAPISPRDQPVASTAGFLPEDGIDVGEYVELTNIRSYRYRITADRPFYVLPRDVADEGMLNYTGSPPGSVPDHEIYLIPPECGLAASRRSNANDGLRISCDNCPELPYRPQSATVEEYVVDSSAFYLVPGFRLSNYRGSWEDVLGDVTTPEIEAWQALNPTGQLRDVQRSQLIRFTAPPGTEELYVRLTDVVFNTDYYESTGLADGIGASLIGFTRADNRPIVLEADYRKFLTLQTDRNMRLTLDLSRQSEEFRDYGIVVWRVAAVQETNPPAIGTFTYPGNYISFGFQLDTPLPPPPPPPHDACGQARSIPYHPVSEIDEGHIDTISIAGALPDPVYDRCSGSPDVWLTFIAESSQLNFYAVDSDSNQSIQPFQLLRGEDCGELTPVGCYVAYRGSREDERLDNLTVGARYYIRVYGETSPVRSQNDVYYSLYGPPRSCTSIEAELAGTECVDAVNYLATLNVTSLGGQPRAYVVNAFGDTLLTVASTGTYTVRTYSTTLQLVGDEPNCNSTVLTARTEACFTNQNDECTGAFVLPASPVADPVYAVGSTNLRSVSSSDSLSGPLPDTCGAVAGAPDVWFVASNPGTEPASLGFTLRDAQPGQTNYATYFYSGSCGDLTYLTCSQSGYVEIPDVPAGGQIFLRSVRINSRFANNHTAAWVAFHPLALTAEVACDALRRVTVEGGFQLMWSLQAPPANLAGWIVQRSTDLTRWTDVLRISAYEGTTDSLNYSVYLPLDGTPPGLIHFRLLSVSPSGDTEQACNVISDVREPRLELGVYPNPVAAGGSVTVAFPSVPADRVAAWLTDGLGRNLPLRPRAVAEGLTVSIPGDLPAGFYVLRIVADGRSGAQPLVIR